MVVWIFLEIMGGHHQFRNVLEAHRGFCKHFVGEWQCSSTLHLVTQTFKQKQIVQTETEAIEYEGRFQKGTMLTPLLDTRSVPVTDCKEKLLLHKAIGLYHDFR